MKLKLQRLNKEAVLPSRASEAAAGYDLYAVTEKPLEIAPGQTVLVHTGWAAQIPDGYAGFIFARSGLATKEGLAPANKVGVIDADYRGEIMVSLYNQSGALRTVTNGQRIAQLVLIQVASAELETVEQLDDTRRGSGGFGSTGKS